jgi:ketosteroid isomerase-like protein
LATKGAADKAPPTLSDKPAAPVASAPAAAAPSTTTTATKTPATAATVEPAAKASAPTPPAAENHHRKDVEAAVTNWAKAWAAQDMKDYLGAYGKEFNPPGKMSRSEWEAERRQRIVGKAKISVKIEKLSIQVNGETAVAKFQQSYKSGALAVSSRKQLELAKTGDRWLIIREAVN